MFLNWLLRWGNLPRTDATCLLLRLGGSMELYATVPGKIIIFGQQQLAAKSPLGKLSENTFFTIHCTSNLAGQITHFQVQVQVQLLHWKVQVSLLCLQSSIWVPLHLQSSIWVPLFILHHRPSLFWVLSLFTWFSSDLHLQQGELLNMFRNYRLLKYRKFP